MDEKEIKQNVQKYYGKVALSSSGCCPPETDCCSGSTSQSSSLIDYGVLGSGVEEANLGLGCGIPLRYAAVQPGERVLDLGSGAGIDALIAARQTGLDGQVIGVDFTAEMIARAQATAERKGFQNVEFRLGEIENLPVEDESVDLVISNCVINLVPDKRRAFAEIYRVLKPGGRFTIADTVTSGIVPNDLRSDSQLWSCCVAGAMDRVDYLQVIAEAGFQQVQVYDYVEPEKPPGQAYSIASITVEARKPV